MKHYHSASVTVNAVRIVCANTNVTYLLTYLPYISATVTLLDVSRSMMRLKDL